MTEIPGTFVALLTFLAQEIATLEADRREANFWNKRKIDKKLKGFRALAAKAKAVQGK